MLYTQIIHNKVNHVVNKISKTTKCDIDIWVYSNYSLEGSEYEHLIDANDNVMYAFDIAVEGKITPYMKNQIKYMNRWLDRYNMKNDTKYICLSIFSNL